MTIGTPLQALGIAGTFTVAAVGFFFGGHPIVGAGFTVGAVALVGVAGWLVGQAGKPDTPPLPTLDLVMRNRQRPYVMERTRSDEETGVVEMYQRWYRVGVISDRAVNVHVLLESVAPESEFVYPAHGLQVMNRPAGTEWVDVQPGEDPTVFVDVFTQTIDERSGVPPDETRLLHLCCTTQPYRLLPNRRQRLGLRIEGGGASRLRHFLIDFDARGLATFTPD